MEILATPTDSSQITPRCTDFNNMLTGAPNQNHILIESLDETNPNVSNDNPTGKNGAYPITTVPTYGQADEAELLPSHSTPDWMLEQQREELKVQQRADDESDGLVVEEEDKEELK